MKKKYGFTLAEILITLGIIGVIAAMTLPSLINNYKKQQTVNQLKKAYSTFAQALVLSQYENEESKFWSVTEVGSSYEENLAYFEKYWKPYLKVIKICKTMTECGYDTSTGYKAIGFDTYDHYPPFSNVPGFIYGDGTYAYIRPYGFNDTKLQLLSIDINSAKKPNTIGKDVFQFQINTTKGTITEFGKIENCTKTKVLENSENSRPCGGKIIHDGWIIKDDYPW